MVASNSAVSIVAKSQVQVNRDAAERHDSLCTVREYCTIILHHIQLTEAIVLAAYRGSGARVASNADDLRKILFSKDIHARSEVSNSDSLRLASRSRRRER
jgi:hypothetical protein